MAKEKGFGVSSVIMRIAAHLAVLIAMGIPLTAQVQMYRDVEFWEERSPGKFKDHDGRLSIDRTAGGVAFHKDNEVLRAFSASDIKGITYHTKGDSILQLRCRNAAGVESVWTFKLKGDKKDRENVVTALEAASQTQAQRVETEFKKQ